MTPITLLGLPLGQLLTVLGGGAALLTVLYVVKQQRRRVGIAPVDIVKTQALGKIVPGRRARHAVQVAHCCGYKRNGWKLSEPFLPKFGILPNLNP